MNDTKIEAEKVISALVPEIYFQSSLPLEITFVLFVCFVPFVVAFLKLGGV